MSLNVVRSMVVYTGIPVRMKFGVPRPLTLEHTR
jgi:hypothetical protein